MKSFRQGQRPKLSFRNDPLAKYAPANNLCPADLSEKDFIKILARRAEELKSRGYPGEWIRKDLEKLMEGMA